LGLFYPDYPANPAHPDSDSGDKGFHKCENTGTAFPFPFVKITQIINFEYAHIQR
jgi:hypothetical protein